MRTSMRTTLHAVILVAATSLPLAAQGSNATSPIALALAGCWEPMAGPGLEGLSCVVPGADGASLRIVSVEAGTARQETFLMLNGSRSPLEIDGCRGWQTARTSSDGERILIAGELTCGAGPAQKKSGAYVITPQGTWLRADGNGVTRIARSDLQLLRPVNSLLMVPASLRQELSPLLEEAEEARERLRSADVTARDLVELEARGAAAPIIDAVVAAANPLSFHLEIEGPVSTVGAPAEDEAGSGLLTPIHSMYFGYGYPTMSWVDYAYLNGCSPYMPGFGRPGVCSYNSFYNFAFGGGRYWNPYGIPGYWPGYYPNGGVVIVTPVNRRPEAGGRVVRGQGHDQPGTTSGTRTASPRSVRSSEGTSVARHPAGTSNGGNAAASGSSSSGGSSSSSGTRTAKPRSP